MKGAVGAVMMCLYSHETQLLCLHTGKEESVCVTLERNRETEREREKGTLMSPCNGCPGKQALATVISRLMMSGALFN